MSKRLVLFLLLLTVPAWAGAQSIDVNVPIHTQNKFDRLQPMQDWQCSAAMASAGTVMLRFFDTNGTPSADYVDCHGLIHSSGAAGVTSVCMNGDGTVYNVSVPGSCITHTGTLAPTLKAQQAATFLAGPRLAVPGAAAVIQSTVPQVFGPPDPTAITITMDSATIAGDAIILATDCFGSNVNAPTPVVTDSQGNSWPTVTANGPDQQVLTVGIAGGPETIHAAFSYGVGVFCPRMAVSAIEVTNLTGVVDGGATGAGRLLFSPGTYTASLTTALSNDFLFLQTVVNNTISQTISPMIPLFSIDRAFSDVAAGSGIYADSYTTTPGTYNNAILTPGQDSSSLMVAYQTGGTFNPAAPWVARTIGFSDLPPEAQNPRWDTLSSPALDLALSMGTHTSTFNYTANSAAFTFTNQTAATALLAQNSPVLTLKGSVWTGAASAVDGWEFEDVIANGANGESILSAFHFGGPGNTSVGVFGSPGFFSFPRLVSLLPAAASYAGHFFNVSNSTAIVTEGQACVDAGGGGGFALAYSDGTAWKCF